jgi:hypothetical protein
MLDDKTFFSFGGGRQSTAIGLLLIEQPDKFTDAGLTLPNHIIFADTGAEPAKVYKHVDTMRKKLTDAGYQFHIVNNAKQGEKFKPIDAIEARGVTTVPWFTKGIDGTVGMLKRQCTNEFKVQPIHQKIRELLGYKKGERVTDSANLWLGISTDESNRTANSPVRWLVNQYPLLAINWNAVDCSIYGTYKLGYPIPKSACYFCPFTRPSEWMRRKQEDPQEFLRAVELDNKIRHLSNRNQVNNPCFVHSSGQPLSSVIDQLSLPLGEVYGFGLDKTCGGHCGL